MGDFFIPITNVDYSAVCATEDSAIKRDSIGCTTFNMFVSFVGLCIVLAEFRR